MKKLILTAILAVSPLVFADHSAEHTAALKHGQEIYNGACATCHAPQTAAALKSPALHDTAAWKVRFDAAEAESKKDSKTYPTALDYLVHTVKNGKNAMPAGGMCKNEKEKDGKCTDADYKAAIEYMSADKDPA